MLTDYSYLPFLLPFSAHFDHSAKSIMAQCFISLPITIKFGLLCTYSEKPFKRASADNFRPITCLPLTWKLLIGIFGESIYKHLKTNSLLKDEQKGCKKKSRGTKDHLLVDKAVIDRDGLKLNTDVFQWPGSTIRKILIWYLMTRYARFCPLRKLQVILGD